MICGLVAGFGSGGWLAVGVVGLVPLVAGLAGLAFWKKRPMAGLVFLLAAAAPHVWVVWSGRASDLGVFELGIFTLPAVLFATSGALAPISARRRR
jgi:hypothetical protein